jgi:methyl-accepting chemotaxis protein
MDKHKQQLFILSIGIASGILLGVLAALVLELRGYIFWGVLLHAGVLIPGLLGLLFCIWSLQKPGNEGVLPVRQDIRKFLESLNTHIVQSGDVREILQTEISERETLVSHIRIIIDGMFTHFSEIETLVSQGIETLNGIETYIGSLKDAAADQSEEFDRVATHVSGIAELIASVTEGLRRSSGQAEQLEKIIADGETQVLAVNNAIKQISREVETITEFTGAINQVSAQTNILSMNAAIESARAGAAGAGFAVVAAEIRKLSEVTRENAKNIQAALGAIIQKTADALKASDASAENLNGVTGTIGEFSRSLAELNRTLPEGGSLNRGVDFSIGNQKSLNQTIRNGSMDIITHNQSFREALENIQRLTNKTRAEIKEIRSGTQEVLEHIQKTERYLLKNLEDTVSMGTAIPSQE